MPEDKAAAPMTGVTDLGDGLTVVDIWQGLHANAIAWQAHPYGASAVQNRMLIDGTDLSVLRALAAYPCASWAALCAAAGWTAYGAVALSWCEGATLPQVFDGWRASGCRATNKMRIRIASPINVPEQSTRCLTRIVPQHVPFVKQNLP